MKGRSKQENNRISEKNWILLDTMVKDMLRGESNSPSGVLISGYAGSGKTFLVENFLSSMSGQLPVLTARHYVNQKSIPYSGFRYAISKFLSQLYSQLTPHHFTDFSKKLMFELGEGYLLVLDYFPELSLISEANPVHKNFSVPKIENQVYPLLSKIFNFLSTYFEQPVILFTDNLQWMDGSGVNLLNYLLSDLGTEKLIWIGAQRTPLDQLTISKRIIDNLSFEKKHIYHIEIKELYLDQSAAYVESQLGGKCSPELIETCHNLSQGDFFLLQLIVENLKNTSLISVDNGMFHGQVQEIIGAFDGLDKQNILNIHMEMLSLEAQEVVMLVACAGSISKRLILQWLSNEHAKLDLILEQGSKYGLLTVSHEVVTISQLHLGELIYQGMDVTKTDKLHYQLAKLLHGEYSHHGNLEDVILAANHLNKGLSEIRVRGEMKFGAALNFHAGIISKQKKVLEQSKEFFKACNILLSECKWEDVIEMTWSSYLEIARTEYELGEYDFAEIHLDFLLERFFTPEKRIDPYLLKIIINNHLGRYRKVVQILKESLNELGLQIPENKQQLDFEINMLKKDLIEREKGKSVIGKANFNHKNKHILDLLYVGGMALHHTSDLMMTWASLQIILMSDKPDMPSAVKAIGYVSFARMMIISGQISKGFEFGTTGLNINKELGDLNLRCRVYGVFAFYIKTWKDPFSESFVLIEEGIEAGKRSGDHIGEYILSTHLLNLKFISGSPLSQVLDYNFEKIYPANELTYYITHYQKSLIDYLTGKDTIFSIPRLQGSSLAAQLTIQEEKFYRFYVWGRYYFLFGFYKLAEKAANEADQNRKLQEGSPLVPANLLIRFLSITQCWNSYDLNQRDDLSVTLDDILRSFALWAKYAPANYSRMYFLLKAELKRIQGKSAEATKAFKQTLSLVDGDCFLEGVAKELFAKHLLSIHLDSKSARVLLEGAIAAFNQWGAIAKVNQIIQQYQGILLKPDQAWEIDIETIQQELSGDLEVTSLVRKLMVLLLRFSGSSRVVVKMKKENDKFLSSDSLTLLNTLEYQDIPESLILFSHKTQTTLMIDDVDLEMSSTEVNMLKSRGVKSYLILPINITGHLSMVIYLESSFAKSWYNKNRLKWTRITSNQGAIIIENAMIHEQTIQLNNEITNEMYEKQRLSKLVEQQQNNHLKDLMEIQDKERNRIASDLHDSLGSMLSTVRLKLNGIYERNFRNIEQEKSEEYNDALGMLDESIEELRRIAHHMAPASLKKFGLKITLESFVENINSSGLLKINLQILGFSKRIPEKIEISIFRICQELLQNTMKHANATHASLQLIRHLDRINVLIEDNGKGMDTATIVQGLGFMAIQSKAKLLGGTFEVDSFPNRGTTIIIDIPLKNEKKAMF
ncbi:AAA family ATPase [Belliella sp. R4-6]|uniref:AAA family ATPase n=1 Tax=Belliella alkalica TaxID=1730871 RepID=A0ABS9V9J6_9BACT|nr:AAA family ATPase [Belliella alkalica]MCH7413088.1 AAA family ATPase [Belliella alkalica]